MPKEINISLSDLDHVIVDDMDVQAPVDGVQDYVVYGGQEFGLLEAGSASSTYCSTDGERVLLIVWND